MLREEDVVQNDLRSSVGEGGTKTPLSLISVYHGQKAWQVGGNVKYGIPLNLYSTGSRSLVAIGFVVEPLVDLSTPLVAGRRFSSCLRNGLRMMGISNTPCRNQNRILLRITIIPI